MSVNQSSDVQVFGDYINFSKQKNVVSAFLRLRGLGLNSVKVMQVGSHRSVVS